MTFKDVKKEREMVKWEHMKAMDYLREPSTKSGGKRGGAESRAVVFRGVGAGSGMGPGPAMDLKSEMTAVTEVGTNRQMFISCLTVLNQIVDN